MITHTKPTSDCIPGFWEIPDNDIQITSNENISIINPLPNVMRIDNFLSEQTCDELVKLFQESNIAEPVSVNGLKDQNYGIGSVRATGWSEQLANRIQSILLPHLEQHKHCNPFTATDFWQYVDESFCDDWKPIGVSPMLRFMRYNEDSEHFAHYDAGFFYPDSVYRTLKSMVIYLTTNDSGATRFIDDDQSDVHVWNRKHDDWNRRVYDSEVIYSSYPQKGSVLLFDHRLCHDVQQYDGKSGDRIIIRGDIIYETII